MLVAIPPIHPSRRPPQTMVLRAAALALTATLAVKVLLNKLGFRFWSDYGGLDGIVSFSSRLIAGGLL